MAVQTTTGTYAANLNTYQIIAGSLRLLGVIQAGEIVEAEEYEEALEALNAMTKHWMAMGIHVWSEIDCHLFLNAGQNSYVISGSPTVSNESNVLSHFTPTIGYAQTTLASTAAQGATSIVVSSNFNFSPGFWAGIWLDSGVTFWARVVSVTGNTVFLDAALTGQASSGAQVSNYQTDLVRPLKVPAARRYQYAAEGAGSGPIEIPLMIMSRIDYANMPNKSVPGTVTQFFYDPQLNAGTQDAYSPTPGWSRFFVWPAPSDNRSGVRFTAQRPLQDFSTQANYADLPQEWISTLRYNLAVELAPEYDCNPQRFEMISSVAQMKLGDCKAFDREPEPVMFGVSSFPSWRS